MTRLALTILACLMIGACSSEAATASPACGGFHLGIVNNTDHGISVGIQGGPGPTIAAHSSMTLIDSTTSGLPPLPWRVVLLNSSDSSQIATYFFDGHRPAELIVFSTDSIDSESRPPCATAPPAQAPG